jgi:hypothetical protein
MTGLLGRCKNSASTRLYFGSGKAYPPGLLKTSQKMVQPATKLSYSKHRQQQITHNRTGETEMKSKLIVVLALVLVLAAQIAPALAAAGDPSQWG